MKRKAWHLRVSRKLAGVAAGTAAVLALSACAPSDDGAAGSGSGSGNSETIEVGVKVPRRVLVLGELPRTGIGKIARAGLRDIAVAHGANTTAVPGQGEVLGRTVVRGGQAL